MDSTISPLLKKGDYINGSFVKSAHTSGYINDGNPGDRSDQIGRFPFSLQNTKEAILFAAEAQKDWKELPFEERIRVVENFKKQLETRSKFLSHTLTREIGIPLWEAKQECSDTHEIINVLLEEAKKIFASIEKNTTLLPAGPWAMLTPFSQPLLIPSMFSCAAILMGNSVVHKPSKYTPGVGQSVAEIWDHCKLPRALYNMVQGPGSHIGQYLISHAKIQGTLFAGSYSTAIDIQEKKLLPPHHNFLGFFGGKTSAIVTEHADLELTAREILSSAFRYSGQRPNSIARVFITRPIFDVLVDTLAKSIDQIQVGNGFQKNSYFGPMISEHWRTRYHRFGNSLYSNGHNAIRQPENIENDVSGYYVKPALYQINWTNGSPVLQEEPPGPSLLLYEVNDLEEAVALHNRLHFRRSVSIFGTEPDIDLPLLLRNLKVGGIFLNQAPTETGAPIGLQGHCSNSTNSGKDLLYQLTQKQILFR